MDWIVGRKYLHKRTSLEYKCIAITSDNRPVMERQKDVSGQYFIFDVLEEQFRLYTLIEEEKKLIGYVNIYPHASCGPLEGAFFRDRLEADRISGLRNRVACVAVYEGDGL